MDASPQSHSTSQQNNNKEKLSVSLSFCLCSSLTYFIFLTLPIAAQDILAGTHIQTSSVLLADIGPYFLVALVFPYFAKRVPYIVRFVVVLLSLTTAFLILGLSNNVAWKLFSVTLASFGIGLADTSFLALTSFFHPSVLSVYSTGTGVGFLFSSLYYTAMTTWFCVAPNVTLLILTPTSLLYLLCYYFIQKEIGAIENEPATRKEVAYSKLQPLDSEDDEEMPEQEKEEDKAKPFTSPGPLTWKEKLLAVKKMFILVAVPVIIGFSAEYIFFQSIITTIAYTNAPFRPRDHYQYYALALMLGELAGRSHRSLLGIVKPSWLYVPTATGLWALSIIEVLHLLFLLFESWYRFLPGVGIPIFLCLTAGVDIGIFYSYVLEYIRVSFEEKEREFIMSCALAPINLGVVVASLVGLYVEPRLREHCLSIVTDHARCFTRPSSVKNIVVGCRAEMRF